MISQHVEAPYRAGEHSILDTQTGRAKLVAAVLDFVTGTALYPQEAERLLLTQFVNGLLTIEQVLLLLPKADTDSTPSRESLH